MLKTCSFSITKTRNNCLNGATGIFETPFPKISEAVALWVFEGFCFESTPKFTHGGNSLKPEPPVLAQQPSQMLTEGSSLKLRYHVCPNYMLYTVSSSKTSFLLLFLSRQ